LSKILIRYVANTKLFNKDLINLFNLKYIYIDIKINSNLKIEIVEIEVNIEKILAKKKDKIYINSLKINRGLTQIYTINLKILNISYRLRILAIFSTLIMLIKENNLLLILQ